MSTVTPILVFMHVNKHNPPPPPSLSRLQICCCVDRTHTCFTWPSSNLYSPPILASQKYGGLDKIEEMVIRYSYSFHQFSFAGTSSNFSSKISPNNTLDLKRPKNNTLDHFCTRNFPQGQVYIWKQYLEFGLSLDIANWRNGSECWMRVVPAHNSQSSQRQILRGLGLGYRIHFTL